MPELILEHQKRTQENDKHYHISVGARGENGLPPAHLHRKRSAISAGKPMVLDPDNHSNEVDMRRTTSHPFQYAAETKGGCRGSP